jgi:hypothetical protein
LADLGGWTNNDTLFRKIMKQRGNEFMGTINYVMKDFPENMKISEYKELLCKEEDGKVVDGFGKMIYELNIDEENKDLEEAHLIMKRRARKHLKEVENID